eukprot:jgi/Chlat1/7792/Chrsp66S07248
MDTTTWVDIPELGEIMNNIGNHTINVCEESYGFVPCSTNVAGNIMLMLGYGYMLLTAARLISAGSELLLQVLNPGIIGGLLLPVLGAFPDSLLIVVSGLAGTREEAQDEVLVGVGVLAGSTIMLLTIGWGGSLVLGRCDLVGPNKTAKDKTLTHGWDLFHTGVTTDQQTRFGAVIMILSTIPFFIIEVPQIDKHPSEGKPTALAGWVIALSGLVLYCIYQLVSPWQQQKKIERARMELIRTKGLRSLSSYATYKSWGGLLSEDGTRPNQEALERIFKFFDKNHDGLLSRNELEGLVVGLGVQHEHYVPNETEVEAWMSEFDVNADGNVSQKEFVNGITKWTRSVHEQRLRNPSRALQANPILKNPPHFSFEAQDAQSAYELLLAEQGVVEDEEEDEEHADKPLTKSQVYKRAALLLLAGTILVGFFADPMVNAINNFSKASQIPAFFVAFVVTPFASNASELLSSLLFAMKKRKRNISLTYSQIYGAITMNNTLCLGIFLVLVWARGLVWNFSSEVLVILLCTFAIGYIGSRHLTFPHWMAYLALAFYPLSIALVAFLDYGLGWQ